MKSLVVLLRNRYNVFRCFFLRKKLTKRYVGGALSILSNNCVGALICHDIGIRFDTPTVNPSMSCDDFLAFVENLPAMLREDVVDVSDDTSFFPIGRLAGLITIRFKHYGSFAEAQTIWNRRRQRVDLHKLVIIMTDNSNLSDEAIDRFKRLPFCKKLLVNSPRKAELLGDSGFLVRGDFLHGFNISDFSGFSGRRYYHQFDFVAWLNACRKERA